MPEKISLKTEDGVNIKGNFYDSNNKKSILLLHQFSRDKDSWNNLINVLLTTHSILAIDLRGHGESEGNYEEFDENDFKRMSFDVQAGIKFLEERGFEHEKMNIIGSSIGANLAQNYAAENKVNRAILLSPGLNFKGIELIVKNTPSLIICSRDDVYSYQSVKKIESECDKIKCAYLDNRGHGVDMLDEDLMNSIQMFLID